MTRKRYVVRGVPTIPGSIEESARLLEEAKNRLHAEGYVVTQEVPQPDGVMLHAEPAEVFNMPAPGPMPIQVATVEGTSIKDILAKIMGGAPQPPPEDPTPPDVNHEQHREMTEFATSVLHEIGPVNYLFRKSVIPDAVRHLSRGWPASKMAAIASVCDAELNTNPCPCPLHNVMKDISNTLHAEARKSVS